MAGRKGRRTTPKNSGGNGAALAALKRAVHGAVLHPPPDPPTVVDTPWYNLVVTIIEQSLPATPPVLYTVADIIAAAGIPTTSFVKLVQVRVWGPMGGSVEVFMDDPTNASVVLQTIKDTGTTSARPRVGYLYPSYVSDKAIATSTLDVVSITASTAATAAVIGTAIVTHFHIKWRLVN